MGSRSSRRRSASAARADRADYARLLRQDGRFLEPSERLLSAARTLEQLGLLRVRLSDAVLCANPNDRDFPPEDPGCPGRIEIRDQAEEGDGDYACPACDRAIYPNAHAKDRFPLLHTMLDHRGIERFVLERCGDPANGHEFQGGLLILPSVPQNRFVCILDFCTTATRRDRAWGAGQPCVFVTVDPRAGAWRRGTDEAVSVELVDLVIGDVVLEELITQTDRWRGPAVSSPRPSLAEGSVATPAEVEAAPTHAHPRHYVVRIDDEGILVNGIFIVQNRKTLYYKAFKALVEKFGECAASGREVVPLTEAALADLISKPETDDSVDPRSVRRAINWVRSKIVLKFKQRGQYVERGDVIENMARAGKFRGAHGYRLNPDKVILGPIKPIIS